MRILQEGMTGADVGALQQALDAHGFRPGALDGSFGPGTEAAVMAFQRSSGLLADGVVGPRTAAALGLEVPPPVAMPAVTVALACKVFPNTPVAHVTGNLPAVLAALEASRLTSVEIVSAALATIRAEVEDFEPVAEGQSRFNTSPGGRPFDLYDARRDLGNQGPPDGLRYRGRGYVQLTGRANYAEYGPRIGLSALVDQPDLACDPEVAARLLAAFIGAKEVPIKQALVDGDLAAARRYVNGGTNGLDRFADAYRTAVKLLQPA